MAIIIGKGIKYILHLFSRGGTALPGLVALYFDPNVLSRMTKAVKFGSIVVTGTNGKTTTARMITEALDRNGYGVMNNRSGSNLERGLVSGFLDVMNWRGETGVDVAILEIDEADLPNLVNKLSMRQLVITNFFRDQLDRYGELLSLRNLVRRAIEEMPTGAYLILNADDPLVSSLDNFVPDGVTVKYYGLELNYNCEDFALDGRECFNCGEELYYDKKYLSHLGHYYCSNCGYRRHLPDVRAVDCRMNGLNGSEVTILGGREESRRVNFSLPGLFNIYNLLAVLTSVEQMEVDNNLLQESLVKFKPVFGRFEKVVIGAKIIYLLLSKNPTGFNELIKTICLHEGKLGLIFILNDNYADGRDISWIWDIDIEKLRDRVNWLAVAGGRAEEMMMRVKYADFNMDRVGQGKNYRSMINDLLSSSQAEEIFVLATYTGMMEFRAELHKMGYVSDFWKD